MMNTVEERINELFANSDFVDRIRDLDTFDAVFEAVSKEIPDATKSDLDAYFTKIGEHMSKGELTEDDLEDVSGGVIGTLAVLGAVAKLGAYVAACYGVGVVIGKYCKTR